MSFFTKRRMILSGIIMAGVLLCSSVITGYALYRRIYSANVKTGDDGHPFLYIPTGSSYEQVCDLLARGGLQNMASFKWLAGKMHYPNRVNPGRYRLTDGMNNLELIRMLRQGRQTPVKVVFHNIRTGAQLAGKVAAVIEADSAAIVRLLADSAFLLPYRLTPQTALSLFIPNTYELFWNTSAEEFIERMEKEHTRFWNDTRRQQARKNGMTPLQVSTLASIVEEETQMNSEKPAIAGVYVNRLQCGMPLQADPTLKFAAGDFTIRRILNTHKEINSPYNTYLHRGLPPGPICVPSIASLDAVLNYQKSDYLYFCAREDFSGYHNFARTLARHNVNRAAYQRALDKLKIYR
jgi:UPF0755 protein